MCADWEGVTAMATLAQPESVGAQHKRPQACRRWHGMTVQCVYGRGRGMVQSNGVADCTEELVIEVGQEGEGDVGIEGK